MTTISPNHVGASRGLGQLVIPAVALLFLAAPGCEKKPNSTASTTSTPAAQPASAPVNWSKVQPTDAPRSIEALSRICRLLDVRHKGADQTVKLTFSGAAATDSAGASYPVTPEQWKGIGALATQSPDGKTMMRALPAANLNYADGLGPARRIAYSIQRESDSVLIFTIFKKLDDNSNG
jgi:hypothetical protein